MALGLPDQVQCCPAGTLHGHFYFSVWPGDDPAIQFRFGAERADLDHRVSQLRRGPVMTEKQIDAADGIKLRTFFLPDSTG
jgi:hypothetical protein